MPRPDLPELSAVPRQPNMVAYRFRSEGDYPRRTWIAVCVYPDCVREFDGRQWRVTEDLREKVIGV